MIDRTSCVYVYPKSFAIKVAFVVMTFWLYCVVDMLSQSKNHSPTQTKNFLGQKKMQNTNIASYEDLLVAEYLEQFQTKHPRKKTR